MPSEWRTVETDQTGHGGMAIIPTIRRGTSHYTARHQIPSSIFTFRARLASSAIYSGYVDVYGIEQSAFGSAIWLNRLDTYQSGGIQYTSGTPQNSSVVHHAGNIFQIAATDLLPSYTRVRFVVRNGEFLVNYIKWIGHKVAQVPSVYTNADNIYGNIASLSDKRLKNSITPIAGNAGPRYIVPNSGVHLRPRGPRPKALWVDCRRGGKRHSAVGHR